MSISITEMINEAFQITQSTTIMMCEEPVLQEKPHLETSRISEEPLNFAFGLNCIMHQTGAPEE